MNFTAIHVFQLMDGQTQANEPKPETPFNYFGKILIDIAFDLSHGKSMIVYIL